MIKKNKDLKEKAYQEILGKIIRCEYVPGSMINEEGIAAEFGLSRTPVREAISRLQLDGYLEVLPKRGIRVSDVTLDDALQIFQARIEIEPIALQMAAPYVRTDDLLEMRRNLQAAEGIEESLRLDWQMHLYLIDHCQNRYIIEIMHKVFRDSDRIVVFTKQNEVKVHDAKVEHLAILDSLINKDDPAHSAVLMRTHIMTCRRAALDYFSRTNMFS
jgi:DNA-binding GntR family transcriptional regulator